MADFLTAFGVWAGLAALSARGAEVDLSKLPPPAAVSVDFERDIKPLFENHCYKCHGGEKPKSKFSLLTRESVLKGGEDNTDDVVPGDSAKSKLIHYVARLVADLEMPPPGKGEPLKQEQIALLRAWIDQGVNWSTTEAPPPKGPQFSVSPTLQFITVSGNENKFREHYWTKEGWAGGLADFSLKEKFGGDRSITVEGRVIPNQNDYKVGIALEKMDVGFARFGFEEFRKYFNDTGGYYARFSEPAFSLNRDLHLDVGRAWADFGLTLPDWPKVTLGYEYQFKDGAKSTLQWGDVYPPAGESKKIYPAYKDIDEKAHVIKLDVSHEVRGVQLEDNFRAEFYDLDTTRFNPDIYQLGKSGPDKLVLVKEGYNHFQAANTFRLERQFTDWLFASSGYLYSRLDGDAALGLNTILTPFAMLPPPTLYGFDRFWFSRQILLNQQTHVFNANTMLGPWQGLTFSAGLQSEWMSQHGFGDVRLDEGDPTDPANFLMTPALLNSDLDKFSVDENFSLRFTKIPGTMLYAEGRFQQESIGQFEEQSGGDADFLRNTAATGDLKEYRAGFSISPWERVSLNAHYKHRDKKSNYDHLEDSTRNPLGTFPNEGYSAFIRFREIETDTVEAKLVIRPASWWKTTFSYQIVATDYLTATDPVSNDVSPGGRIFAGNYDAHVYSVNATLTPWRRLYLSTTFSYRDTRTVTADNHTPAMAPYRGDIYNVLTSATYVLNQTTDLLASYSFSRADYGQNNEANGLPLGIVYEWHGLQAGLTHRFKKNTAVNLQYGFYNYDEPSSGQINNYTAHAIFATLTLKWP